MTLETIRLAGSTGPHFPTLDLLLYRVFRSGHVGSTIVAPLATYRLGSPHAGDNIGHWKAVEYHPLYVAAADVEAHKAAQTELVPQTHPDAKL